MFKFLEWKRQRLMSRVTSEIEEEKCQFEWRLKNVHEFLKIQQVIESPIFIGGPKSLHQWRLIITKATREGEMGLILSLELVEFGAKWRSSSSAGNITSCQVKADFKISSVKNLGEIKIIVIEGPSGKEFKAGAKLGSWFLPETLLSKNLEDGKNLRILCDIRFEGQVEHKTKDQESGKIQMASSNLKKENLDGASTSSGRDFLISQFIQSMSDWSSAFVSGLYSDVSIVTETRTFPAHKVVLAARSPVFGRMFVSENAGSGPFTLEIKDFDEHVVILMLQHMYCGIPVLIDPFKENVMELLRIAEKYEIAILKQACEHEISSNKK